MSPQQVTHEPGRDSYHGVPPVKPAPFDLPHIPLYFWLGGIASGSWLAATADAWADGDDRSLVRSGRYLAAVSLMGGSALLIADLGRPERFLNMLRIVRPRSPMSLGSWALTGFGALAGTAGMLQAAEDGLLGKRPLLARLSTGATGRAVQMIGLPVALFTGTYTGALLSSTATPGWAWNAGLLAPLFAASAVSSGLAAVAGVMEATGGTSAGTARRLARAQALALGTEAALHIVEARRGRDLPSVRREPAHSRVGSRAAVALGMGVPLVLNLLEQRRAPVRYGSRGTARRGRRRRSARRLISAGLALAGSLAVRFLTVERGTRSARTPEDTWVYSRDGAAPDGE